MIFIFFILVLLCFIKIKNKKVYSILIGILLVFVATFRDTTLPDAQNYIDFAENIYEEERYEPITIIIKNISDIFSSNYRIFFFIYALISIFLKIYSINHISNLIFYSILAYYSILFPIHEMIQIRAALAVSLILISLPYIYHRDKKYFLIIALSTLAHYSALIALPLYWLNPYNINKKWNYIIILISFLLAFFKIVISFLISLIPIPFINNLYNAYQIQNQIEGIENSIFSLSIFLIIFVHIMLIMHANRIYKKFKYIYLYLKIQTISIALFFLFNDIPVIGGRLSELLRCVIIFTLPLLIYVFNKRIYGSLIAITICTLFFIRFYTLYYNF